MTSELQHGPQALYPDRYDCDEDSKGQCDNLPCLNLGTESLAATPKEIIGSTPWALGTLSRSRSLQGQKKEKRAVRKTAMDRDCMICFETASRPSRTRCCGKLFCEAHLHDWLAGSSNRCPGCSDYCHPEIGVISLASPVSPTIPSQLLQLTMPQQPRHREIEQLKKDEKATRSRSSSSSSSSSYSSMDTNRDHDDGDDSPTCDGDSFHFKSLLSKLLQHLLDDPAEIYPYEKHDAGIQTKSHVHSIQQSFVPELTLALAYTSSQAQDSDMFLTTFHRSEVVSDDEFTVVASASKVAGKLLTLVALMLVFWVLTS